MGYIVVGKIKVKLWVVALSFEAIFKGAISTKINAKGPILEIARFDFVFLFYPI